MTKEATSPKPKKVSKGTTTKEGRKAYDKAYYQANKARCYERNRRWYLKKMQDPEYRKQRAAKDRAYYLTHVEERNAINRRSYQKRMQDPAFREHRNMLARIHWAKRKNKK